MQTDRIIVEEPEAGVRVDKFLSQRFNEKSRTYFQYLLEEGLVLVNGSKVKKRAIVEQNDEVEIYFQLTPQISLEPENIPLEVLYEDDHVIAINKPAGMVVHPAPGHPNHTFVNALLFHCKDSMQMHDNTRPGIVHRLDKDTSGVLIAAKTTLAHQRLISAFSQRMIEKQYLAICAGKPNAKEIAAPIARHPIKRKEMAVVEDKGKEAISEVSVLAFNSSHSLVLVSPKTGRTHQIRVHLKHVKSPIIGDAVYGLQHPKAERQLLHAYRIKFTHPITCAPLEIVAPLPSDMKDWIAEFSEKTTFS